MSSPWVTYAKQEYSFTVLITKETLPSGGLFEKTFTLKKEKKKNNIVCFLA